MNALSAKCGIAKSTLSRWESGQNEPDLGPLNEVLEALNASEVERMEVLALMRAPRAIRELHALDRNGATLAQLGVHQPHAGTSLRGLRLSRGFTVAETAARLQVSERTLHHYEAGTRCPSADQIRTLSDLFGTSISEFFEEQASVRIPTIERLLSAIQTQEAMFANNQIPQPGLLWACERAAWRFSQVDPKALPLLGHQLALSASAALEVGFSNVGYDLAKQARELPWYESPEPVRALAPYAAICGARVYTANLQGLKSLKQELLDNLQHGQKRPDLWAWLAIVSGKLGDGPSARGYLERFRILLDQVAGQHAASVYALWHSEVMIDLGQAEQALHLSDLTGVDRYDFEGFRAAVLVRAYQSLGMKEATEDTTHLLIQRGRSRQALNPFQSTSLVASGVPARTIEREIFQQHN